MHYGKHEIDTYQNRNMVVPSRQGDDKDGCEKKLKNFFTLGNEIDISVVI